ncbi:hypothetical protein JVU11DRAFT_3817 [Chiua virens]|nr:hypothetical protein JVU11DRAFT_11542 [Chiua virens]KAG9309187.1 hypothetical protein JVU11DRAFT_10901 [Chiua virens]KAG9316139.1 hypothetical protein JVU11DRAFT_3817 [Chiua virens]
MTNHTTTIYPGAAQYSKDLAKCVQQRPEPVWPSQQSKRLLDNTHCLPHDTFEAAAIMAKRQRADRLASVIEDADRIRMALNAVKDHGCGVCYVLQQPCKHDTMYTCPNLKEWFGGFFYVMDWKKKIRYPTSITKNQGICWKCHVPSCADMLHGPFTLSDAPCEWEDIIVPTLIAIWKAPNIHLWKNNPFGKLSKDLDGYAKWLLERPSPGYCSKVIEVFLRYVEWRMS